MSSPLWLALYLPRLSIEVFADDQPQQPLAVSREQRGRRRIMACNAAARDRGIQPGQGVNTALAIAADLRVHERSRAREAQALDALAAWAYARSRQVSLAPPRALLLEIGASLNLFGGLQALLVSLLDELEGMGWSVRVAVTPTPAASLLLARAARQGSHHPLLIESREALPGVIADLPLRHLAALDDEMDLLEGIGLSTIGECLSLPRDGLSRRLGPRLAAWLDKVLGRANDPRVLWQPPESFEQRLELAAELASVQGLVFPARRLLGALSGWLRGHGRAVQQLNWRLLHREGEDSLIRQSMARPQADAERLLNLFRERIEREQLRAPVLEIVLSSGPLLEPRGGQQALFDEGPEEGLLLERLHARLGAGAIHSLAVVDDHRPERATARVEAGQGGGVGVSNPRPVWLLEQPRLLTEPPHPDDILHGPERIESGWWDGEDQARDYYIVRDSEQRRLWVYRDLRGMRGWWLAGVFEDGAAVGRTSVRQNRGRRESASD